MWQDKSIWSICMPNTDIWGRFGLYEKNYNIKEFQILVVWTLFSSIPYYIPRFAYRKSSKSSGFPDIDQTSGGRFSATTGPFPMTRDSYESPWANGD